MHEIFDKWYGLIGLLAGVYSLLLAYRVLPLKFKNPEQYELWHRKFGKMMKWAGLFLVILGPIQLYLGLTQTSSDSKKADYAKEMKMLRTQAGQADQTGWVPAQSTHGGFFVYLPSPFNEIESDPIQMKKDDIVTTYTLGATGEDIKCTASFWKYQNGIADYETYKDKWKEQKKLSAS